MKRSLYEFDLSVSIQDVLDADDAQSEERTEDNEERNGRNVFSALSKEELKVALRKVNEERGIVNKLLKAAIQNGDFETAASYEQQLESINHRCIAITAQIVIK